MATFNKRITDYFPVARLPHADAPQYESPATVFLREVVNLCDAIHHCQRTFTRKKNNDFTKDSSDSFQIVITSAFALLMSHFETYQKSQFAEMLNARFMFELPDELVLARRLERADCNVTLSRVLAGGGEFGETGQIIADAMPGWHNAERVNGYFRAILPQTNIFSNELVEELDVLWQLRHSIVHTAGRITREDAMKLQSLKSYGDRKLVFGEEFMPAIGRRFHIMIQVILDPLQARAHEIFQSLGETDEEKAALIEEILGYSSKRNSWFRKKKN